MALTDQVKGYWKLNAAGLLVDATGLNPALTNNNGVTSVAGKVGEAALFDGTAGQSLSLPDSANLSVGDIDFSLGAWVKLDNTATSHVIVSKAATTFDYYVAFEPTIGDHLRTITFDGVGLTFLDSTAALVAGVWYFVMFWKDAAGDTVNLQINNGAVESAAHVGGAESDGVFRIGAGSAGAQVMVGSVDEVLFAKRVYTDAERTALYNGGAGVTWPFATLTSQTGPGGPIEGMLLSAYERTATLTVEGFRNG